MDQDPLFRSAPPHLSPQQRAEVREYIHNHPEIRELIQGLMTAIISNKPDKPLEFAAEYFRNLK